MRNINKLLLEIVLIIFCVCPILGYGQQAPEAIMVGAPLPLTGMYAGFGEGALFGIKAAVDDINKLGGVYVKEYGKRIPIKLIVVNNESDPMKGGSLAEDLIVRSRVHFLVSGDQPPPMHAGVATVSDRYKVPYVTCSGPLEPWSEMRTKGKWEYSWATGLFAIATPAPQGDFRAKPGYTIVDTWAEMLKLYGDIN
uniref:Leucine-binding protein domain-containing protein n=1 Tax=candidate division WOR-3 bacterium TaxID=2052148 RepID=A0A7C2NYE5_UNCW3